MIKNLLKLIKISMGNIIEWYDFCLYAYFAVVISKTFFTFQSSFISLLATFAVFGVGFLAAAERPSIYKIEIGLLKAKYQISTILLIEKYFTFWLNATKYLNFHNLLTSAMLK